MAARTHIDLVENSDEPHVTRGAGGKAPAHLGQFIDDEAEEIDEENGLCKFCALENCRCAYDIDAQDEEEDQLDEMDEGDEEILTRSRNYKREFDSSLRCEEEYADFNPDLAVYFAQYDLTEQQQIAMCRTYANYLSQKVRSRLRSGGATSGGGGKVYGKGSTIGKRKWKRVKLRQPNFEEDQE